MQNSTNILSGIPTKEIRLNSGKMMNFLNQNLSHKASKCLQKQPAPTVRFLQLHHFHPCPVLILIFQSLFFLVPVLTNYYPDCVFLSCQIRVLEWIYTLQLPECQGTPFSKQACIWSLIDWNEIRRHNQLVRKRTLNHLAKLVIPLQWLTLCEKCPY